MVLYHLDQSKDFVAGMLDYAPANMGRVANLSTGLDGNGVAKRSRVGSIYSFVKSALEIPDQLY